eukprot:10903357-Alexandrium_andersonii.AAC.1
MVVGRWCSGLCPDLQTLDRQLAPGHLALQLCQWPSGIWHAARSGAAECGGGAAGFGLRAQ